MQTFAKSDKEYSHNGEKLSSKSIPEEDTKTIKDESLANNAPENNKISTVTTIVKEEKPESPAKEQQPEVVSRSGRKIKPKRFLDGEEEELSGSPPTKKKVLTSKQKVSPSPVVVPPKKANPFGNFSNNWFVNAFKYYFSFHR